MKDTRDIYMESYPCTVCGEVHVEYGSLFDLHYSYTNTRSMFSRTCTRQQHRRIIARRILKLRKETYLSRDYRKGRIDQILRDYRVHDRTCADCKRYATILYFNQIPVCAEHYRTRLNKQHVGEYEQELIQRQAEAQKLK